MRPTFALFAMKPTFALFATALVLSTTGASCHPNGILNPPTGPGTDYPCGLQDRSCGNGKCCGRSEECGTGLGCPKDSCCPLEDDFYAGKPRQSRPQFAPRVAP